MAQEKEDDTGEGGILYLREGWHRRGRDDTGEAEEYYI
jgi:hypothetical protein